MYFVPFRTRRLNLGDPNNQCPRYDIKLSDGKGPAEEIWGMLSTPSLPLLPGPLSSGLVAPDSLFYLSHRWDPKYANKWLMLNCDY